MKHKKSPQVSLVNRAVERRSDLVERIDNPFNHQIFSGMMQRARMMGDNLFESWWTSEHVVARIENAAREAELYAVTAEMMDLVMHAASKMPPQKLLATDLPSRAGYVLFETPFPLVDVNNMQIDLISVLWREEIIGHAGVNPGTDENGQQLPAKASGVVLYVFCDMADVNDPVHQTLPAKIRVQMPSDSLMHMETVAFGRTMWTLDGEFGDTQRIRSLMQSGHDIGALIDAASQAFGPEVSREAFVKDGFWEFAFNTGGDDTTVRLVPDQMVQFMSALWHFMGSSLTEDGKILPSKSTMRGLPRHTPLKPVTVVQLRRRESLPHGNQASWSLSYRYMRRGFWRKQWYGSGDDRFQREIWIAPTMVGDESLPFNKRSVVNVVSR